MLVSAEGHPTECLASPAQNCQGHEDPQGKSEKLSQPRGELREHDDQTSHGVLDGFLGQKKDIK